MTAARGHRIVVGVDGSPGAAVALRWALDEAALRNAAVEVVSAWHVPALAAADTTGLTAGALEGRVLEAAARKALEDMVASEARASSVEVTQVVREGAAAEVLIERARGADLLVVGSRGRGGFKSLLLGSVSQHCAQHAPCPVMIVPSGGPAARS